MMPLLPTRKVLYLLSRNFYCTTGMFRSFFSCRGLDFLYSLCALLQKSNNYLESTPQWHLLFKLVDEVSLAACRITTSPCLTQLGRDAYREHLSTVRIFIYPFEGRYTIFVSNRRKSSSLFRMADYIPMCYCWCYSCILKVKLSLLQRALYIYVPYCTF